MFWAANRARFNLCEQCLKRRMIADGCPTITCFWVFVTASLMACPSAKVRAIGFSIKTCLPASSACTASARWVLALVASITPSISFCDKSASYEAKSQENWAAKLAPRASSTSLTAASAPSSLRLRAILRPHSASNKRYLCH